MRLTRHVRDCCWSWPTFSDDPVVQFCVEEALKVRLELHEHEQAAELELEAANEAAIAAARDAVQQDLEAAA